MAAPAELGTSGSLEKYFSRPWLQTIICVDICDIFIKINLVDLQIEIPVCQSTIRNESKV